LVGELSHVVAAGEGSKQFNHEVSDGETAAGRRGQVKNGHSPRMASLNTEHLLMAVSWAVGRLTL
jgi:hypothetical protein